MSCPAVPAAVRASFAVADIGGCAVASRMACARLQPASTLMVAAKAGPAGSSKTSAMRMSLIGRAERKSSKEVLFFDNTGRRGEKRPQVFSMNTETSTEYFGSLVNQPVQLLR